MGGVPGSRGLAWVTGASAGIGREVALRLAGEGWTVAATARRGEALASLAAEVAEGTGRVLPCPGDVTDREGLRALVADLERREGPVSLAFLNAGDYRPMPLAEFDAALFRHLMEVNYLGVVHALEALLPGMLARRDGEILINASVAGYRGLPKAAPYGATKAALIHLAEALQPEAAARGLRLRVVNHGFVRSALTDKNDFPMPFLIEPAEAARRIVAAVGARGFEIGFPRRFTYQLKLLRCLPYRWYLWLMRKLVRE